MDGAFNFVVCYQDEAYIWEADNPKQSWCPPKQKGYKPPRGPTAIDNAMDQGQKGKGRGKRIILLDAVFSD